MQLTYFFGYLDLAQLFCFILSYISLQFRDNIARRFMTHLQVNILQVKASRSVAVTSPGAACRSSEQVFIQAARIAETDGVNDITRFPGLVDRAVNNVVPG